MAYMQQEKKKSLAPAIKAACAKHGVKATLGVDHHSSLVLNIKEGSIDFIKNYNETMQARGLEHRAEDNFGINPYHYETQFTGEALSFFKEVMPLMNVGNFDKSDIQSDYFHCGWYVEVNIGKWDRPYQYTGK